MTEIRTRFAPSPTGYLHIGGARTAIFSWLYARRHGGKFILRIEDTDLERSTDESIRQIIEAMDWLGLDYDEGPFRQTARQDIYKKRIDELLDGDHAYRCVCPKETLDKKRALMMKSGKKPMYDGTCRGKNIKANCGEPFVIRFKTPKDGETIVEDLLRGEVRFNNEELDDMIIARSDGSPTYNFCVVIDDSDMKISHVIRGDDHLANTPRQAVIYKALGLALPKFAHVSMILGRDGARLSKRHGAMSVMEYRDRGFLPGALLNYLVRLGWSHGDQEVFTLDEMKTHFDFGAVSKSAAKFDEEKLLWLNTEYLRAEPPQNLAQLVAPFLEEKGVKVELEKIEKLIPMLVQRAKTIADLANGMTYFFTDNVEYNEKAATKFLKPAVAEPLKELSSRLNGIDFSSEENIETAFRALIDERGMKLKELAQPVRIALTGGTVSPGLFEVMKALGQEKCVARIKTAGEYSESGEHVK